MKIFLELWWTASGNCQQPDFCWDIHLRLSYWHSRMEVDLARELHNLCCLTSQLLETLMALVTKKLACIVAQLEAHLWPLSQEIYLLTQNRQNQLFSLPCNASKPDLRTKKLNQLPLAHHCALHITKRRYGEKQFHLTVCNTEADHSEKTLFFRPLTISITSTPKP